VSPIGQRASDDDRSRVVAELERHTADGRLSLDEFSDRVDQVYRAATHDDLARITGDLPRPVPARNDHWHLLVAIAVAIATIAGLALSLRFW
jgi:hypothetical protein